jgi:hypothetical protein
LFDVMKKRTRKFAVVLLIFAVLTILFVWFWSTPTSSPKLSVTFLRAIDGHGHWRLQLGITNVGRFTVSTSKLGEIEVFNQSKPFHVGATSPLSKLAPGQGQLVVAILSEAQMNSLDRKWRYTCLYAREGLRSRIYRWQWGPTGPGARVNWLIPQALKGMPLTVKATSDWIEPVKP